MTAMVLVAVTSCLCHAGVWFRALGYYIYNAVYVSCVAADDGCLIS